MTPLYGTLQGPLELRPVEAQPVSWEGERPPAAGDTAGGCWGGRQAMGPPLLFSSFSFSLHMYYTYIYIHKLIYILLYIIYRF